MKKDAEKENVIGENGWPNAHFIEEYILNAFEFLRGDKDFWDVEERETKIYENPNNVDPQKIYTFISAARVRNYENKHSESARDGVFGPYKGWFLGYPTSKLYMQK